MTATLTVTEVTASTVYDVTASGGDLAGLDATVTLSIVSGQNIADTSDNNLSNTAPTGTNENTWVVDNIAPTVTITGVPPTSTAAFMATFTFSDAVTEFVVGDITLGNATASEFTMTSTTVYTALITPTDNGTVTVDVAVDVAADAAGNGNTAATATSVRALLPPGSGFLVGNFGQPADGSAQIYVTHDIVGVFTTGARGAELHSIEFRLFTRRPNIAVLPIPSVTLYRASVTDSRVTRGGEPVATLTVAPESSRSTETAQTVAFNAPDDTGLDAGATYLVLLEHTSYVRAEATTYPAEDAGGARGWEIDGIGVGNNSPYSYWTTSSLLMRVNGTPAGPTVATAPEAPASLVATADDAQVTLSWTPPGSDGGAGIEKYQYRYSAVPYSADPRVAPRVDPETAWTDVPDGSDTGTSLADERSVTVTELDNGRQYAFEVRAVNSVRAGAARAGAAATARLRPRPLGAGAGPDRFLVSEFRARPWTGTAQTMPPSGMIVGVRPCHDRDGRWAPRSAASNSQTAHNGLPEAAVFPDSPDRPHPPMMTSKNPPATLYHAGLRWDGQCLAQGLARASGRPTQPGRTDSVARAHLPSRR